MYWQMFGCYRRRVTLWACFFLRALTFHAFLVCIYRILLAHLVATWCSKCGRVGDGPTVSSACVSTGGNDLSAQHVVQTGGDDVQNLILVELLCRF